MDKPQLSNTTIGLMIGVALFFDVLQWLLAWVFMDWLVTPLAYGTFWLWFKMKGVNFFSRKRAATLGVGALIEMIPFIDVLPTITFVVVRVALDYKIKKIVPGSDIIK